MRFLLLSLVCLCNLVNYMHNSTIAIALVLMCDASCELLLARYNDTRIITDCPLSNTTMIFNGNRHHLLPVDYMEYSGDVGSIALNFLYMNEEGLKHMSNHSVIIECTWQQIRNCQRLKWSHHEKALVLSASYWSSLLFQIPCGIVINRFGGYRILSMAVLFIGVINLMLPIAAHYDVFVVIVVRFTLGLLLTASSPASYKIIEEWMTTRDRSVWIAMLVASQTLGNVIILTSSGYLINSNYDWSAVFYVSSVTSFVVSVLFALVARDKPHQAKWMSQVEVNLINSERVARVSLGSSSSASIDTGTKSNASSVPWRNVMTNKPYLSLLFFIFCTSANNTLYTSELPLFLDQVSDVSIVTNGLLNGSANVARILAILISGYLSEKLIARDYFSRTAVRKLFSLLLGFGQSICLLILPYVTANTQALTCLVILATFASGMSSGSTLPLHYELSLKYPVVLLTISNTVANINGILVPLSVSFAQGIFSSQLMTGWVIIFLTAAIAVAFANIFFLLYIQAERQPFDFDTREDKSLA